MSLLDRVQQYSACEYAVTLILIFLVLAAFNFMAGVAGIASTLALLSKSLFMLLSRVKINFVSFFSGKFTRLRSTKYFRGIL